MIRPTLPLLLPLLLAAGCSNRGADDRVSVDQAARAEHHGPAYTVVALRHCDRARLSNGAVIVNSTGEEPVYVMDVGYVSPAPVALDARAEETQAILARLDDVAKHLDQARGGAAQPLPAALPAPAPVEPAAPAAPLSVAPTAPAAPPAVVPEPELIPSAPAAAPADPTPAPAAAAPAASAGPAVLPEHPWRPSVPAHPKVRSAGGDQP